MPPRPQAERSALPDFRIKPTHIKDGKPRIPASQLAFELRLRPVLDAMPAQTDPDATASIPSSRDSQPAPPQPPNPHAALRPHPAVIQIPAEDAVRNRREEAAMIAPAGERAFSETDKSQVAPVTATGSSSDERKPASQHTPAPVTLGTAATPPEQGPDSAEALPKADGPRLQSMDEAEPSVQPPAVADLRLQVEGPAGRPIDVRLLERDGRLHLAVHTQDAAYNESLRERVGELLQDLENHGFHAESVAEGVRQIADTQNARAGDEQNHSGAREEEASDQHRDSSESHRQRERQFQRNQQAGKVPKPAVSFSGELAGLNQPTKD
jgi:hypothetical protein